MRLKVTVPDTFNGPLDLLLHLIRRDELDIHDIPIAKLANAYLEEMEKMNLVDVDEATEFLDLASRLLEIKSRMLLPPDEAAGEDDEDEGFDPRTGLVEALLEYRRFKDAAKALGEMADEQARRYPRIAPKMQFQFVEDESGERSDCEDLFNAFQAMLLRIVPTDESTVITYNEVPTSVRIEQISTVLGAIGSTRFSLLLSGTPNRREMVGFFIAILEMIRRGKITARQSEKFTDIIIELRAPTPGGRPALPFARIRPTAARLFSPLARAPAAPPAGRKAGAPFPPPAPGGRGAPAARRLRPRHPPRFL